MRILNDTYIDGSLSVNNLINSGGYLVTANTQGTLTLFDIDNINLIDYVFYISKSFVNRNYPYFTSLNEANIYAEKEFPNKKIVFIVYPDIYTEDISITCNCTILNLGGDFRGAFDISQTCEIIGGSYSEIIVNHKTIDLKINCNYASLVLSDLHDLDIQANVIPNITLTNINYGNINSNTISSITINSSVSGSFVKINSNNIGNANILSNGITKIDGNTIENIYVQCEGTLYLNSTKLSYFEINQAGSKNYISSCIINNINIENAGISTLEIFNSQINRNIFCNSINKLKLVNCVVDGQGQSAINSGTGNLRVFLVNTSLLSFGGNAIEAANPAIELYCRGQCVSNENIGQNVNLRTPTSIIVDTSFGAEIQ